MKTLPLILLLLAPALAYAQDAKPRLWDWSGYGKSVDGKQYWTWAAFAVAGTAHGMREAYHANPYCFEQAWGVSQTSFWGSDAWKRNYIGGNPDNAHKSEWAGNVGRDIWHTANAVEKVFLVGGVFAIGARKQPLKYRAANLVAGIVIQSAFSNAAYAVLR